ncbi:hypothetical protein F5884DRAFT_806259 [Xylogone sp. PMI_703]|nr:hypothetical protein F5884DRAFT_806259 [Xylogone sp. PMI_703]
MPLMVLLVTKVSWAISALVKMRTTCRFHSCRALIITTNRPETLDEALIRPNRVDLKVVFTKAKECMGHIDHENQACNLVMSPPFPLWLVMGDLLTSPNSVALRRKKSCQGRLRAPETI